VNGGCFAGLAKIGNLGLEQVGKKKGRIAAAEKGALEGRRGVGRRMRFQPSACREREQRKIVPDRARRLFRARSGLKIGSATSFRCNRATTWLDGTEMAAEAVLGQKSRYGR
jgi:hypothetical protein